MFTQTFEFLQSLRTKAARCQKIYLSLRTAEAEASCFKMKPSRFLRSYTTVIQSHSVRSVMLLTVYSKPCQTGTSLRPNFLPRRRCVFELCLVVRVSCCDATCLIDSKGAEHARSRTIYLCRCVARPFRLREKTCSRICSGTGFRFPTR